MTEYQELILKNATYRLLCKKNKIGERENGKSNRRNI